MASTRVRYEDVLREYLRIIRGDNWTVGASEFGGFAASTGDQVANLVAVARTVVESDLIGHPDLAAALDALDEVGQP